MTTHLGHLCSDRPAPSPRFRGTQAAADAALAAFDVAGYARRRNEVWPVARRGASGLSPWIRHGLLTLPDVWAAVDGPIADRTKFRDELLWQEYGRHLYARLGSALSRPLRHEAPTVGPATGSATGPTTVSGAGEWDRSMLCVDTMLSELDHDGWLVNQARLWLAGDWTVRHGADWRVGEQYFFAHLLDGSRAANRAGWQWTVGTATGRPYGFARAQVERRAPGLCGGCALRTACPIEHRPDPEPGDTVVADPRLRRDPDAARTAGPATVLRRAEPEVVWLTAESLGDADPALAAHPSLPVVFVFDEPLLRHLALSGKRLVLLTERLAELAVERNAEVFLGHPPAALADRLATVTFAPVPGWRRHADVIEPAEVHPWPWLRTPGSGSLTSFSAWRR